MFCIHLEMTANKKTSIQIYNNVAGSFSMSSIEARLLQGWIKYSKEFPFVFPFWFYIGITIYLNLSGRNFGSEREIPCSYSTIIEKYERMIRNLRFELHQFNNRCGDKRCVSMEMMKVMFKLGKAKYWCSGDTVFICFSYN